jgi:hypothetical protein
MPFLNPWDDDCDGWEWEQGVWVHDPLDSECFELVERDVVDGGEVV